MTYRVVMDATASRVLRIRLLQWLLAPLPLAMAWVVWSMDAATRAKEFTSDWTFAAFALFVLSMSSLLAYSPWLLIGRYVSRIELCKQPERVRVTVLQAFGTRVYEGAAAEFVAGPEQHGTPGSRTYTPTFALHTPEGRRLIVDMQGSFPEGVDAVSRLFR